MANRRAAYSAKYLTREPRTLVVKFTSNGSTGAQTLASAPYNEGVVNVVASATGVYKVNLGASDGRRDPYNGFAGIDFASSDGDKTVVQVSNTECNSASDPNITFVAGHVTNGAAAYVDSTEEVFVRLHFLDSTD